MIDVYQPPRQKHPRRQSSQGAGLQRVLFALIALCLVGISVVAVVLAREYVGNSRPAPHPTLSPVASLLPTHTLTPSPAPLSPTPSPTPTPEPTLPPGVLSFPLYSGNPHLPEIALTFDDAPTYTAQILAILQHYGVQATFFVIGSQAAAHPDLVEQEFQQGHIVGNHTWTHPDLTTLSPAGVRSQLQSASNEIEADTNQAPTAALLKR
jgi:peptidoglycan/xylan/chitin deacetylase (PgdA/CDA1 family)